MYLSEQHLSGLGLGPARDVASLPSAGFDDGGRVRIEIPSVEGPEAMRTVIARAAELQLPVHRVSQGSGVWMLTDEEISEMVSLGAAHGIELILFVGPRGSWGIGRESQSSSGAVAAGVLSGYDELAAGTDEVMRALGLGVDGVLVADLGHLMVLGELKRRGDLPESLQLKVSVSLPIANPATARVLQDLGATSLNLPVDLPVPAIASIRRAVDIPIDMYVEAADDFGGSMRYYEIPQLVDAAAPVYLKFTTRNAPNTYPSGQHLRETVLALAAERVRRAALGVAMLRRYRPDVAISPAGDAVSRNGEVAAADGRS